MPTVESIRVAHEALLRHWDRAREQIALDRADLQLRARLEEDQARWVLGETDRDSLLLAPDCGSQRLGIWLGAGKMRLTLN